MNKRWLIITIKARGIFVKVGGLYIGARFTKPRLVFINYYGKRTCWQLQTWKPRVEIWRAQ